MIDVDVVIVEGLGECYVSEGGSGFGGGFGGGEEDECEVGVDMAEEEGRGFGRVGGG
jgi:hypothetical protein